MQKRVKSARNRPVSVTILSILVLIIAMMNLVRFMSAIRYRETLVSYDVTPGPLYIGTTGLVFFLGMAWLFWILWNGHPRSRMAAYLLLGTYILFSWLDRFLFQSHLSRPNTPFAVGVTILVVFYIVLSLSLPSNQAFFSRTNEQ